MLEAGEVRNFSRAKLRSQRKFRPRHQPVREMIALRVIARAFGWDLLQGGFERTQVGGASNLCSVGKPKHKIAKAELLFEQAPQVCQERRRALAQKRQSLAVCARPKLRAA